MASITISSPGGAQTNPTNTFLPYNNNGVFADSALQMISNFNFGVNDASFQINGLSIDNTARIYQFGDFQGVYYGNSIVCSDDGNTYINGQNLTIYITQPDGQISIFNDNITSATAGLLATYLKLSVNGVKYKIALLNDTL